jgi:hypothetical protein
MGARASGIDGLVDHQFYNAKYATFVEELYFLGHNAVYSVES